jgi:hypothetical protein
MFTEQTEHWFAAVTCKFEWAYMLAFIVAFVVVHTVLGLSLFAADPQ